jgi:hypothetical protein
MSGHPTIRVPFSGGGTYLYFKILVDTCHKHAGIDLKPLRSCFRYILGLIMPTPLCVRE